MAWYALARLLQALAVLAVMSLLVFAGVYALGNPVDLLVDPNAGAADYARRVAALGLDQPLWVQYARFVVGLLHGDLGNSFVHGTPALHLIFERMPATLEVSFAALMMALASGVPLGLVAGFKPQSWIGRAIRALSVLGFSLPTFWVGLMFIMLFAVELGWLPAGGRGPTEHVLGIDLSITTLEGWRHLLLPAVNLALFKISLLIRLTAASTQEILRQDYIRFARAKGLHPVRIVGLHVLKNALVPIVTVLGLEFGSLVAFAVVTESVFAWPGMGKLLIDSITLLDRPVVVAYLLVVVLLFVSINFIVDLLYGLLDPRVRLGGAQA
ncbi:MAG: ABC transporter permease [Rhodocyclaceae bacterium]|nr:ABC transporter permease [Rhodocyclaceae bacterium]